MNKSSFSIKDMYKSSLDYLKKSKNFIFISFVFLLISFFFGLIFPLFFKEQIFIFLDKIAKQILGLNSLEIVLFIFKNNVQASFLALILGVLFGIFPLVMIIINGYLMGFVLHYSILAEGFGVIWKLFPHGVFEIPAILISSGLGIKIGYDILFNLLSKKKHTTLKKNLLESAKVFIFVILPLLIIAAIIEGLLIFFLMK